MVFILIAVGLSPPETVDMQMIPDFSSSRGSFDKWIQRMLKIKWQIVYHIKRHGMKYQ